MNLPFIMLMIALAQLIIVQAILAREILEELFRHGTLSDVRQVPGRHRSKNVAALSCRSQAPTGICAMLRGGFCYNFVIDCLPTNFSSKKHQNYNDLQSNMTQSLNSDGNTSSYKATKQ